MKIKVKFWDITLLKNFLAILSIISLACSFTFIFVKIPDHSKPLIGCIFIACLLLLYVGLWIRANLLTKTRLIVNNSTVNIKVGDIFDEPELKVIAFNEYFDTLVDNKIISERTLNGIYIQSKVQDLMELNHIIHSDSRLNELIVERNVPRKNGNTNRYKLGTILEHNQYLLTAFSRFDQDNRAYLHMNDYVNFLLNFWNEVDIIYNGRSVSIPLLGSGITRMKEYSEITDQELLELLIWSFKVSRTKFKYPSVVNIIIDKSKKDKINFYKLKGIV